MLTKCRFLVGTYGLLLIIAANGFGADGEAYKLEYKFKQGQTVQFAVEHDAKVFLQQEEAEQHIDHGSITDKQFAVKSVDGNGNAVLELQIDRVRMTAKVDGGDSIQYDSNSGEEPPTQLQGIADTVGKPHVRVKVTPHGELQSIDWLIGGDQTPKPTKDDAASLDILVVLPEEPVKVGETWKEQFETEVSATASLKKKVKIQREYTLKEIEGDRATISLKTIVITPLHDAAQESQIVNKTPKGTIIFDLKQGAIVSRTLKVDKLIVGFNGPNSKVHNVGTRVERMVPAKVAIDAGIDAVKR